MSDDYGLGEVCAGPLATRRLPGTHRSILAGAAAKDIADHLSRTLAQCRVAQRTRCDIARSFRTPSGLHEMYIWLLGMRLVFVYTYKYVCNSVLGPASDCLTAVSSVPSILRWCRSTCRLGCGTSTMVSLPMSTDRIASFIKSLQDGRSGGSRACSPPIHSGRFCSEYLLEVPICFGARVHSRPAHEHVAACAVTRGRAAAGERCSGKRVIETIFFFTLV
ncbi:unnamed protein product [Danaus chrysippus]|uniref:(African queen) hypothetical protein n=1 Tax=Danaus chrysippus TaxID=151541 RepID=A0A8J2QE70_9NEOP|nr:unnamed protein product [Danaus chrysippus]